MTLTPAELLAIYAILSNHKAPGARVLAARVREVYDRAPREGQA